MGVRIATQAPSRRKDRQGCATSRLLRKGNEHRNKCYLPSWSDREKRERSGRRMHERKQRDWRRKERWDEGGKRGKDKKQKKKLKIRGRKD